jgi:hypothetical protein
MNHTKQCTKCQRQLPQTTEFFWKVRKDGEKFRSVCRECTFESNSKWKKDNSLSYNEQQKDYYYANKQEILDKQTIYKREKRRTDLSYRLVDNLRRRLNQAIKGQSKASTTMDLMGCTADELKVYIESMFESWMNWDNYGMYIAGGPRTWVIDHIKPCASFDLSDPEQQKLCFHHSNLQPLCGHENILKSDS